MAIIKNAEIHYIKCDPKRPDATHDKKNPSWQVQLRTTDLATRDLWKSQDLNVKLLTKKVEGADEDEPKVPQLDKDGNKIYRVNLKKGSIKKNGEKADPVKVVQGDLSEVNPNTIANGSIANVRVFQYPYEHEGKKGITSMLMAIQLVKHIVYVPRARDDDFEMQDTETVNPDPVDEDGEDLTPQKPKNKVNTDDEF